MVDTGQTMIDGDGGLSHGLLAERYLLQHRVTMLPLVVGDLIVLR